MAVRTARVALSAMSEVPAEDLLVLRACREGDTQALGELVRRWERPILSFLTKATGDPAAAKDLRQEVFLRVLRYGASYKPEYAFSTWLYRIARNVLSTWQRKHRRTRSIEVAVSDDAPDQSPSPCDQVARNEVGRQVRESLAALDADERQLLLLRFDLELSYREIGEILELPETTVKSRLYTLLRRLRRSLSHLPLSERTRNT
jgi:RNA polymerase sigma-70 factor (ECF subfamily)